MNSIEILSVIGQAESLGILRLVAGAGLVVKLVLAILLAFSVISWAIIILKFRQLRQVAGESERFLKVFWEAKGLEQIQQTAKMLKNSPPAEIFTAGFAELTRLRKARAAAARGDEPPALQTTGVENVQRALRQATATELAKLERAVPFLATTGNSAPFIGLFGTVWGIMNSFHHIGTVGTASLAVVAPGISEALIATAVGLFAAIPAVIFYNHFSTRIRAVEVELENFSAEFLNILERHLARMP